MIGRIGDHVYADVLRRCEGCGQTELLCQVTIDHDGERCCRVCTCRHEPALLKRYGLLER